MTARHTRADRRTPVRRYGKRLPSKRHGRGKRYRVRYKDANGEPRERLFDLKRDTDAWDAKARSGAVAETKVDQSERRITFREYGERWQLSREIGWVAETRRRVESNLRNHLYPEFGDCVARSITLTSVLEWISKRLREGTPKSSMQLYFELLKAVLSAAVTDKVISDNPCDGVKLSQVLHGLSRVPRWVPTAEEVNALLAVVPGRYRAAIWLGAGQGERLGEVLGMENDSRCTDFLRRELHVIQQLRYSRDHGGFYLTEPESGSVGTVDLDPDVSTVLAEHIRQFTPAEVDLIDIMSGDPVRRRVALLFTNERGQPISDKRWSEMWAKWRKAANWPEHGTFHALRHFFATTLITSGVEPQEVQKAMRHASLRITLETHVHWWPKRDRPRGVIGAALREATSRNQRNGATA